MLEKMSDFKYQGSHVTTDGGVTEKVGYRVSVGTKILGVVKGILRDKNLNLRAKRRVYVSEIVPTWMLREAENR